MCTGRVARVVYTRALYPAVLHRPGYTVHTEAVLSYTTGTGRVVRVQEGHSGLREAREAWVKREDGKPGPELSLFCGKNGPGKPSSSRSRTGVNQIADGQTEPYTGLEWMLAEKAGPDTRFTVGQE